MSGGLIFPRATKQDDDNSLAEAMERAMVISKRYESSGLPYLRHLVCPEDTMPARIPTPFPVRSHLIHLPYNATVNTTTDVDGMITCIGYIDDFRMLGNYTESLAGNDDFDTLFTGIGVNKALATWFKDARMVACAVDVTYIGALDVSAGYFIASNYHGLATGEGLSASNLPHLDSLDELQSNYDSETFSILDGARVVFTPRDNEDLEFVPFTGSTKLNSWLGAIGYVGLPAGAKLKVEMHVTYEVIAKPEFMFLFPGVIGEGNFEAVTKAMRTHAHGGHLVTNARNRKPKQILQFK